MLVYRFGEEGRGGGSRSIVGIRVLMVNIDPLWSFIANKFVPIISII